MWTNSLTGRPEEDRCAGRDQNCGFRPGPAWAGWHRQGIGWEQCECRVQAETGSCRMELADRAAPRQARAWQRGEFWGRGNR